MKNCASSIAQGLEPYSNKGALAKFLGIFTQEFGDNYNNYNVAEEFWAMPAGNMFVELPLLRLSMLTTDQLHSPKEQDPGRICSVANPIGLGIVEETTAPDTSDCPPNKVGYLFITSLIGVEPPSFGLWVFVQQIAVQVLAWPSSRATGQTSSLWSRRAR